MEGKSKIDGVITWGERIFGDLCWNLSSIRFNFEATFPSTTSAKCLSRLFDFSCGICSIFHFVSFSIFKDSLGGIYMWKSPYPLMQFHQKQPRSASFLITRKKSVKMSGRKKIKLPRADWSIFHVILLSYWVAFVSFSSLLVYFSIQLLPSSSTTPSLSSTYTEKPIQASN